MLRAYEKATFRDLTCIPRGERGRVGILFDIAACGGHHERQTDVRGQGQHESIRRAGETYFAAADFAIKFKAADVR